MPSGSGWLHEYKYDGYRLLIATGDGVATAWTRNGKDWSDKFKSLVKAAAKLPRRLPDRRRGGRARQRRQARVSSCSSRASRTSKADLAFYAFDLLVDRGEDIRKLPNLERKERLAALLEGARPPIIYGDHIIGKGEALFDAICKRRRRGHHLEKGRRALFAAARTRNWLKIKCIQRQEFVIVGWSESDKRARLPLAPARPPATAAS